MIKTRAYQGGDYAYPLTQAALTDDVTQTDLKAYPGHQLPGRLTYYQAAAAKEPNSTTRNEYLREEQRTRIEINRRTMYATREEERVFKL